MSTDRMRVHEAECLCGEGTFEVDFCTPDHGWPVATPKWYESRIACDTCRGEYELLQQDSKIVVVKLSDIKARDIAKNEAYKNAKDFMETQPVQSLLTDLAAALDALPSMAAAHRLLSKHDLIHESVGTFRKGWSGGAHWVKQHDFDFYLPSVLQLLGQENPDVLEKVLELREQRQDAGKDLPIVGDPIYEISD